MSAARRPSAGQPAWLAAALARVQCRRGRRLAHRPPVRRMCASPAPNSRWPCGASATRRARRASCRRACSTPASASRSALQATAVADADDGKTYRPDGSYAADGARQLDAACRLHRPLVGPGLGRQPDLRQQCAPDPVDHDRAQLLRRDRPSVAALDRAVGDSPRRWASSKAVARTRRTPSSSVRASPGSRTRASRSASRAAPSGAARAGPATSSTFWDLLIGNDNDQPLEEQPGNQMGGLRRALVAAAARRSPSTAR